MKSFLGVVLLSIGGIYAQNASTATGSELPLTKVRHLPRYCDAAFTDEDLDNTVRISRDSMELELWKREETYWKFVSGYDLKQYLTLWDDDFAGYPDGKRADDKAHMVQWIDAVRSESGTCTFNLTRLSENLFDDIAIVYYDVDQTWENKGKIVKKIPMKIMHTWRFRNGEWLLIGEIIAKK